MRREELAMCLAKALNLLADLDPSNWMDQHHSWLRTLQDQLPESIDLAMQNCDSISADDLLNTPGKPLE